MNVQFEEIVKDAIERDVKSIEASATE